MFIRNVFFDADDGGGAGEVVAPNADPSLGAPSADEQTFSSGADWRAARAQFIHDAPPVIGTPPEPVDDEAAAIADLTATPAAPAAPAAPAPAAPQGDPFTEYGGQQAVQQAHQVVEALRTEAGVRAMIAQGLTALGYTPAQIKAFVEQNAAGAPESAPAAPAAPDPLASIADEDLITGADLKTIVASLVAREQAALAQSQATAEQLVQQRVDPVAQAFQQRTMAEAQVTANATYTELLGPQPPEPGPEQDAWMAQAREVQRLATQYVAEDNWNPADIRAGLIRGHAEYVAQQDALFKAYVRSKKADRAGQPTNIAGGHSAAGEAAPEPKNAKEARAIFFAEQGIRQ